MNNIEKEWKKLRDELFQLRFEQKMTKDEETLNKLKIKEKELINKFRKVSYDKVSYEERNVKKR